MKAYFICSLCDKGVLGGGLVVDDASITYHTGNRTMNPNYRHLRLALAELDTIEWKWVVFPMATIRMRDGRAYRFLIFNKWRFLKVYRQIRAAGAADC